MKSAMAALPIARAEPSARWGHAAVGSGSNMFVWGATCSSGSNMFVWGGYGGGSVISSSVVERFNVQSTSWQEPRQLRGQSLPDGLRCMAVASDGERAYCFGGYVGGGSQRCNSLYILDLSSMQCRQMATGGESPTARSYSAMVHYRRQLVVYGGLTGSGPSDELFVFDLDTSEAITA